MRDAVTSSRRRRCRAAQAQFEGPRGQVAQFQPRLAGRVVFRTEHGARLEQVGIVARQFEQVGRQVTGAIVGRGPLERL